VVTTSTAELRKEIEAIAKEVTYLADDPGTTKMA
jgi:hypothetical protein